MYAQQKAIRVERALEIEKVSRLEAMARSSENLQTFKRFGLVTRIVFFKDLKEAVISARDLETPSR